MSELVEEAKRRLRIKKEVPMHIMVRNKPYGMNNTTVGMLVDMYNTDHFFITREPVIATAANIGRRRTSDRPRYMEVREPEEEETGSRSDRRVV